MKKDLMVLLAFILVLLVSCSTVKETVDQGITEEVQKEAESSDEPISETEAEQPSKLSPEIKEVLEKGRSINNYKFLADTSKFDRGVYVQNYYRIQKKGNLVRRTLNHPLSVAGQPYTEIISNLDDKTSIGVCLVLGVTCERNYLKFVSIEYDDFSSYITPHTLIEQVPDTAVVTRKSMVEERQSLVLEYDEAENRVELSVDTYYGLPVKKEVFSKMDDKRVLETIVFKDLIANGVKDSDVMFS